MIHALLIIGHSNSGKSPLGDFIQTTLSTPQKRYFHCDFGSELRRVIVEPGYAGLTLEEQTYVHSVMNGSLIDDDHFFIADKILNHFLLQQGFVKMSDMLILNGFPRNVPQAGCIESIGLTIETVIYLKCPVSVALARKQKSEKGHGFEDRSGRPDKAVEIFNRKIASFEQETLPLVDYYRKQSVRVITIDVGESTSPQEMTNLIFKQ